MSPVVVDNSPDPGYDRDLLRYKIEWEGGIVATIEYGLHSTDIADAEIAALWAQAEDAYAVLRPIIEDIRRKVIDR